MTSKLMTLVFFKHDIISVFFLDMTYTFMTSLFFRHGIYIDDITVFQTWHLHL